MCALSCSIVSNSLRPHGLQPARLLCPWDSPGKNIGVGCHALLQGIIPSQGLNPGLLHALEGVFFTTSTTSTQRIAKEPELAQVTRRMIYAGPSKFGVCLQQYTHRSALSFQWSCYISQPTGACLFVCVCVHFQMTLYWLMIISNCGNEGNR